LAATLRAAPSVVLASQPSAQAQPTAAHAVSVISSLLLLLLFFKLDLGCSWH
jgi:hypothetical protein